MVARIPVDERVMRCYSEEIPFKIRYQEIAPSREVERLARLLAGVGEEWGEEETEKEAEKEPDGYAPGSLVERIKGMVKGLRPGGR